MEKPKNEWENYGETEITFGPGNEVKITERRSGALVEPGRIEKEPERDFDKLNDAEKNRVLAEVENFEKNARGYSPQEIEEERTKIMKELPAKILSERK